MTTETRHFVTDLNGDNPVLSGMVATMIQEVTVVVPKKLNSTKIEPGLKWKLENKVGFGD